MTLLSIVWDVPRGLQIGSFELRYYSLMFAIAYMLGYQILKKIFIEEKINIEHADTVFMYSMLSMVVGARLGHVFFYDWDYYSQNLSEIPKVWHGGLASHGAAVAMIPTFMYIAKKVLNKPPLWLLDRMSLTVALAGVFIRLGNLMNSEIVGKATDLPWAFVFVNSYLPDPLTPRHPSQIYESLGYLITFGVLWYLFFKTDKKKYLGYVFGVFLAMLFSVRFLVEFVKENQESFEDSMSLNMGQWLSVPLILIGIYLTITAKSKIFNYEK
ncbi:MAG: prolipoprotein diacylglyceryl transferase [Ichthyobacteriaceae bacterium]|nr:prolipoprotein diacylglyceryl transferase [Ichthyobacteriaceae bacterium]